MTLRELTYDCTWEELTSNVLVFTCDEVNRAYYFIQKRSKVNRQCSGPNKQYDLIRDMRAQYGNTVHRLKHAAV